MAVAQRRERPNLYNLPAGTAFLDGLAAAILEDRLDLGIDVADPAALARLTVYLPTRRAARAFASVLVRASGRKALILPRLVPLGDPAEAELHDLLADGAMAEGILADTTGAASIPIDPLTRQILLARLVQAASKARAPASPGAGVCVTSFAADSMGRAFGLAGDLGAILDAMQAEDVPYERLRSIDAARFDQHWQITARFLAILGEIWPDVLKQRGEVDPVAWRNELLGAQARRMAANNAAGPVIVAGSTGSMPATARLMATVARQPQGAVVLPDLDLASDETDWAALQAQASASADRAASHPQAQLIRLLDTMQATRADVRSLDQGPASPRQIRGRLAHEALRPAGTTPAWQEIAQRIAPSDLANSLADLTIIEAADERHEAVIIALAIRKALLTDVASMALITPDRALAERVALELGRWQITVDDSAGQLLLRTTAGHLLALVFDLMQTGAASAAILELLHHRHLALGLAPDLLGRGRQALEIGAVRGARSFRGLAGLRNAVAAMPARIADVRAPRPRRRLLPDDVRAAKTVAERLAEVLSPLMDQVPDAAGEVELAATLALIRTALQALTMTPDGVSLAFEGEDGAAMEAVLAELSAACGGLRGTIADLARIARMVMSGRVVRLRGKEHPRVMLLGPLEARLMSPELAILGGLNEATWPPATRTDPFLNRPMRAELGLSSPERRIGQSAHDFIEAISAPRVIITRAAKSGGIQTLPSRFWQRLKAVAPPPLWSAAVDRGKELADVAAVLDQPAHVEPWRRPRPTPPLPLQPTRFSVTEAETLYRDPYAVFARRILDLAPLEPGVVELGAADRGTLLHGVMEAFARAWPDTLPADVPAEVLRTGRRVFADLWHEPDVQGFWWPRFVRLVPAISAWEVARRQNAERVGAEFRIESRLLLADGGHVSLSARADRIEALSGGALAIIDFKSGAVPTPKQIKAALAPQLLLEAALGPLTPFVPGDPARAEAGFGPAVVATAAYVALKPDKDGLDQVPVVADAELAGRAAEHLDGFKRMVVGFRSGERPFTSRFAAQFARFDGDYDHLARVKEWSAAGHDSEDEAG